MMSDDSLRQQKSKENIKKQRDKNRFRFADAQNEPIDRVPLAERLKKTPLTHYLTVILAIVFFLEFMSGKNYISAITGLKTAQPLLTALSLICLWAQILAVVVLLMRLVYDFPLVRNIITYIVLPFSIFNLCMFGVNAKSIAGSAAFVGFNGRVWLFLAENILTLAICLILTFRHKSFRMTLKNAPRALVAWVGMSLVTAPPYFLKVMFGNGSNTKLDEYTPEHILVIAMGFVLVLAVFFLLRHRSFREKRYTLMFIALGSLISFSNNFMFREFLSPHTLPLHLCYTAMYTSLLCLIFRIKKLYYFTLFINVLGAFLAFLAPDTVGTLYDPKVIIFWINHWCAFGMPLAMLILGIYQLPKFKDYLSSLAFYVVYFVGVLIFNAWFSNYGKTDFFFLNSDFVVKKFGGPFLLLLDRTASFTLGSLTFQFYPVYQSTFFVVYAAATLVVWFLIESVQTVAVSHREMKLYRLQDKTTYLKLLEELCCADITEPVGGEKTMIEIKNLTVKYGKFTAVDNLNLEIHEGEIFAVLGHNGAGKSSTIKSMVGIQTISQGQILINGFDIAAQPKQAKMNIGFVPDHYELYDMLTGREYLNYVADLYNVQKRDRLDRLEKYGELLQIKNAYDKPIRSYSHGMKQKITLIASLIHNPKVWILDEPLTGLDPASIFQVKEIIRDYARQNNIVFFSSHIIDVVEKICTRVAIIQKGVLHTLKTIDQIKQEKTSIEELYMSTVIEHETA